jgi:CelD/BcsL family acetyltransferase involved in cellulose biosynthesis
VSVALAFVEAVSIEDLSRHEPAWRDLAGRAAEPNPFAESAFLTPSLRHLAPSRLAILLVWSDDRREALIGLATLREPPLGRGLARAWRSKQAPLAAMTFDREAIEDALTAIVAWMRRARPSIAGIVWPGLETGGAIAMALRSAAAHERLRLETRNPHRRAALVVAGEANFEAALDKKRRKEWARQARRLAERGRLDIGVRDDVEASERFLRLEATGWKGARGTALADDPSRLAFARQMLAAFRDDGRLRIQELAIDGAPVAMGIALGAGARAYYWKTAYDERFAEYSPGVQATLALSRRLAAAPGLKLVDSCAIQDHPMIDRLWPGRLELIDIALATSPRGGRRLGAWLAAEAALARARDAAKATLNRWRARRA